METTDIKTQKTQIVEEFKSTMKDDPKGLFDIYKMYVSSADDITKQRGTCNTFHVSLNTGIMAVFGFMKGTSYEDSIPVYGSIFAILLSIVWIVRINTFKKMNGVKFTLINEIERKLAAQPYNYEWRLSSLSKRFDFSKLERLIPCAFIIAYIIVIIAKTIG